MAEPHVLTVMLNAQMAAGVAKREYDKVAQQFSKPIDLKVNFAGAAGGNMSSIAQQAKGLSTHINNISTAAKGAESAMEAFGRQSGLAIRRFSAFSLAAGPMLALTLGIKNAVSEALVFEKQMIRLEQVTGASKLQIQGVAKEIGDLSTSLGVSSAELSDMALKATQAGVSLKDLKTVLTAVAQASLTPGFEKMGDALNGALGAIKEFGVEAKDVGQILGSVNALSKQFSTTGSDIASAMSQTGAAFKAAGGDVNEFMAMFAAVKGTTRETADSIATGLRTIFSRIQKPEVVSSLERLGIQLHTTRDEAQRLGDVNLEGQFVGAFEAAKRLGEALKGLRSTDPRFAGIAEELGGYRQIEKTIPLLQQATSAQQAYAVALGGVNSLSGSAEKAQEGLLVQTQKLTEQFLKIGREIVDSKFPPSGHPADSSAEPLGRYPRRE